MYNIEVRGDAYNAWVSYGDVFPFSVALYDDEEGTTPSDLTGKTFILGVEDTKGNSLFEIEGIISSNEVVWQITPEIYKPFVVEKQKVKFDFWDSSNYDTRIPVSDLEFKKVAHKTEV